jgi:sortase A
MLGMLLFVGGVVVVCEFLWKNLPSPFDMVDATGETSISLPIITPVSVIRESDISKPTPTAIPRIISYESPALVSAPKPQQVGLIPDRLVIPMINLDAPIIPVSYKGIEVGDQVYYQWLTADQYAVGWHTSSSQLGMPGNIVLNGHHNAFGMVFKDLVTLEIGAEISVYSGSLEFRYQVVANMLLPERFESLSTRMENARWIEPSSDERITLITCWPAYSNTHRVIIVAFPIVNPDNNPIP